MVILLRQALHASRLALTHPSTGKHIEFVAPLAADMQSVLNVLQKSKADKSVTDRRGCSFTMIRRGLSMQGRPK